MQLPPLRILRRPQLLLPYLLAALLSAVLLRADEARESGHEAAVLHDGGAAGACVEFVARAAVEDYEFGLRCRHEGIVWREGVVEVIVE